MPYKEKAKKFLSLAHDFKLGTLPTERPHPKTLNLSDWSKNDLPCALDVFKDIELDLLNTALDKFSDLDELSVEIEDTLHSGGRVFLCGCGATGRLSLALETIWNKTMKEPSKVISFMAGGDVALIHSIENFEDFPEFGEKQLLELGFGENDLLISTTEGGETPFVIGATNAASKYSNRAPYFLYCNPDEELYKVAQRSKEVIQNKEIKKINLYVGEMALSGSTRMQASTILMLGVGVALFKKDESWLNSLKNLFSSLDLNSLQKLIEEESSLYAQDNTVIYQSSDELAISVLTDTTERSPTFSLNSFESVDNKSEDYSLCYLSVNDTHGIEKAWRALLEREPRTLEWSDTVELTGRDRILGFDISSEIAKRRQEYIRGKDYKFNILFKEGALSFELNGKESEWELGEIDLFGAHIILKILLNTHSTLVMGRMSRYESNIMTWVRPSNNKLIDRSIRYIRILLEKDSIEKSYEEVCLELFKQLEGANRNEALVMKVVQSIKEKL
jgi:N-acetylmuramic acid 6-phosphate etherase